ncbi:DeoR/GlpR family DNA-binding transcription regulator [Microbacterium terricola]|uniref:Lactose phosphotransferase system repressor n=1 Tax=Microbacterium terricola TaxID=344163 RepID=A0ABM8DZA9_9MICO|nr:DeoR/GlpR family DNA-binding transcription regulator [Microbacterium terricola]UYK41325.1 DeoR/GlpR family DNA-binding transcription regulator [Microbacterium terricola]BDV30892.1 D-beta-D-heptose 1-phosphate adenosyltransferase [Microbacterium terricola]
MYAMERQTLIEQELVDQGRVSVVSLARRFDVTTETVRRDLAQLESAGALRRVHGGAVVAERSSTAETPLATRMRHAGAAKSAIARRCVELLPPDFHGSLYLDAGTTTAAIAAALATRPSGARPIDIVTHSMALAHALAGAPGIGLTVIGGRVRGITAAAVGADTVRAIEQLRPDIAFVGVNGISAGFGLSTPDPDEAAVKTAIVAAARRTVVAADAGKHGRELLVSFAPLRAVDVLVTDVAPAADLAEALADADAEVLVA